ncbi:hypothetical protein [Amycolatopsis palatopharyngis]|uniref:hypothetical protein n=1 Tax=Amycolatopsis palatopharyngis TaxID=187982 RepID=UPI000E26FA9C|nr:hypothetical protein [Amycolatopsis palatopharyngis]
MGIRLTRTDTGETVEVLTVPDAEDHEAAHPGPWTRDRTPVPIEKIAGFIPPQPPKRTLQERADRADPA